MDISEVEETNARIREDLARIKEGDEVGSVPEGSLDPIEFTPWTYHPYEDGRSGTYCWGEFRDPQGRRIAAFGTKSTALIEAAPALYKALEALMTTPDTAETHTAFVDAVLRASAALAKARGE